jgi:hypothetical protein
LLLRLRGFGRPQHYLEMRVVGAEHDVWLREPLGRSDGRCQMTRSDAHARKILGQINKERLIGSALAYPPVEAAQLQRKHECGVRR